MQIPDPFPNGLSRDRQAGPQGGVGGVAGAGGEGMRQKSSPHTVPAPSMNRLPINPAAVERVTSSLLTPISL